MTHKDAVAFAALFEARLFKSSLKQDGDDLTLELQTPGGRVLLLDRFRTLQFWDGHCLWIDPGKRTNPHWKSHLVDKMIHHIEEHDRATSLQVVYALQDPPEAYRKSIFLAGPSPRDSEGHNWRVEAVEILRRLGFNGVVYVPLPETGSWTKNYVAQVDWELQNLDRADQIVFWVPREMKHLPGLTTNVEFGRYVGSGRAVLGFPTDAPHMGYLAVTAAQEAVPVRHTLEETLAEAVGRIGEGAYRIRAERDIPLHLWQMPVLQSWYQAQLRAGNHLRQAKVLWTFRVGHDKAYTFSLALYVRVFITAEGREKTNEFVLLRPDISTVVCYRHREKDTDVVLVQEFRSAARTKSGFLLDIPGGSSLSGESPFDIMLEELQEETGLGPSNGFELEVRRFRKLGTRQLYGSLSGHHAHCYAVELTEDEMNFMRNQRHPRGVEADTERTWVQVLSVSHLRDDSETVDWATLGMILSAVTPRQGSSRSLPE